MVALATDMLKHASTNAVNQYQELLNDFQNPLKAFDTSKTAILDSSFEDFISRYPIANKA